MCKFEKKKVDNDYSQSFSPFQNSSAVMVSNQLMQDLRQKKDKCVHKYIKLDFFIDSMTRQYFYLSAPSMWTDPFEVKYLEVLNSPQDSKLSNNDLIIMNDMSIFCSCMTYNELENEEAAWKSYGDKMNQLIRVSYDFEKLCDILNKRGDGIIYIGKMKYKDRKEIVKPTPDINHHNNMGNDRWEVLLVNNFCFKQIAYQYEKELRFSKVMKGDEYKQQKEYIITNIDLLPAIKMITLPPVNSKELGKQGFNYQQLEQTKMYLLLKSLCPNVPIHVSNLYNSDKEEMTSEFNILN